MHIKASIINLFFLISCASSNPDSSDSTSLKTISIEAASPISNSLDIFESVDIIHMDTSVVIGEIGKAILKDQTIYLHDINNQSIQAYDYNGDFIFEINNQGRGPREYQAIIDFRVNQVQNELVIFDSFKRSLFIYDLAGDFKKKIPLAFHIDGFTQIDPHHYFLYSNYHPNVETEYPHHNLIKVDTEGQPVDAYLGFDPSINKSNVFRLHQYIDQYNNLLQPFNDTIYHLTASGPLPEYFIDFGKQANRKQCYEDFHDNRNWMEMMNEYAMIRGFHETKEVVTFYYGTREKNTMIVFYAKGSGNARYVEVNEHYYLQNAHSDIPFSPSFFSYAEGLLNIANDLNLDNESLVNPILLVCKFKTF